MAHRGRELVFDFASKAAAEHRRLRDQAREPRPAAIRRGAGIVRAGEAVQQSAGGAPGGEAELQSRSDNPGSCDRWSDHRAGADGRFVCWKSSAEVEEGGGATTAVVA